MIVNHTSRLLGERRLRVARFAEEAGISRNAAHRLYHGTSARIDLPTLDRACRYLGVGVGDILEYVPDGDSARSAPEGATDARHPD